MTEQEFLTHAINEIKDAVKEIIESLPNTPSTGLRDNQLNIENHNFYLEQYNLLVPVRLNEQIRHYTSIHHHTISQELGDKVLRVERSLFKNYGRAILKGTPSMMIPHSEEE